MHAPPELFLSLPPAAQTHLRAAASHKDTGIRKLTRAVYPYVQTLVDAQDIAHYLAAQAAPSHSPLEWVSSGGKGARERPSSIVCLEALITE